MLESFLSCLLFLLLIICSKMQDLEIPSVLCPNYFQYYFHDLQYFGKIMIPTVSSSIEMMVHLSQRQPLQTKYYGRVILENRDPIIYRVEFPSASEVPKVTKITINGEDICTQNGYPPPSTRIYLTHKLTTQPLSSSLPHIPIQQFPMSSFPSAQLPQEAASNNHLTGSEKRTESTFATNPKRQNLQCGRGNVVTPLVFGGSEVVRGEFPWLTAIYVKSAGLRFLCGGSIVSPSTVVSAGHCFKIGNVIASRLVVHLGRHNLEDFSEQGFETREIQSLVIHPDYDSNLFPDADLAILQLKQSVIYSSNIRPICLWSDNLDPRFIAGESGVVAGWGANELGHAFTPIPKKVNTKIVSDSECLRSSAAYNLLTSARTFCAGNRDDTGPCMGDSGNGLMISRNGRWYLRGIVSAGQTKDRQCNLQEFVVFCDVAKHLQWIQSNLVA